MKQHLDGIKNKRNSFHHFSLAYLLFRQIGYIIYRGFWRTSLKDKEIKMPVSIPVVKVEWTEFERGWGQRSDGVSIHLNLRDANTYIDNYWKKEKARRPGGAVPDEYEAPGNPKLCEVTEEFYKKLKLKKHKENFGIRIQKWDWNNLENKIVMAR